MINLYERCAIGQIKDISKSVFSRPLNNLFYTFYFCALKVQ